LVKTETGAITLAIGDGANDVSMIQEAHIGVGIFGKEGTQAARAADYCLQQFKHLKRLLLVHGRYSLVRNATCVQFSLYKNLAFAFPQFWFCIINLASGQTTYDDYILTFFNITISSLPPFGVGFLEKDITEETIEANPRAYKFMKSGNFFTARSVFVWLIFAFYHSVVIFLGAWLLFYFNDVLVPFGTVSGMWTYGFLMASSAACIVLFKFALETRYWTPITHVFEWISLISYFILIAILSGMPTLWPKAYYAFYEGAESASWWLCLVITVIAALLPDFTFKFIRRYFFPKDYEILQELYLETYLFNGGESPVEVYEEMVTKTIGE